MVRQAHRKLTDLHLIRIKRDWTLRETKEMHQCIKVIADWVQEMDGLKQLSFYAYEIGDMDWQQELCAKIEKLTFTGVL